MVTLMYQNVIDYDFVNDVVSTKKFNFLTLHVVDVRRITAALLCHTGLIVVMRHQEEVDCTLMT